MSGQSVRIMGIDPGLTRCGVGIVDAGSGRRVGFVAVGVIRTDPQSVLDQRLYDLHQQINEWFERYQPQVIAVERVFSQHNVRTVMGTAQAAGIAVLVAAQRGVPVHMHTPSEVKAAITGNGRADKKQVTAMITKILRLTEPPQPADAADALALATCHSWRGAPSLGVNSQADDTDSGRTPAQQAWAAAEQATRKRKTG